MTLRIGINGFGRIGRLAMRVLTQHPHIECVGINDLIPSSMMAHLFKYDSSHGRFQGKVTVEEGALIINGKRIATTAEKDPAKLNWRKLGADIILECTGLFTDRETASQHLTAGAKKVIISAPAKEKDLPTFVCGVNLESYRPTEHHVVSNASCTTNCLAPVAKVLHDQFGVEQGFMTTIHSYTNDQCVVDAPHKDLRRARAAAVSQIPTTTGAAKAVGLVLPELSGKLDGMAIRIPTANVSCVDFVATLKKSVTENEVNRAFKTASESGLKNILGVCDEPCVSVDFMGDPRSAIVDTASTKTINRMVKVLAWYDNEIGFCNRMIQLSEYIGQRL